MSSFIQRQISISIALAQNSQTSQPNNFAENGTPGININGLRTQVRVQNSGAAVYCTAEVKIWGLTPSLMNQLATLGLVLNVVPKNIITIQAGDALSGLSTVFQGTIWAGYGDYRGQPDVPFTMECLLSGANAVQNVQPVSFKSSFDVAAAMKGFAQQMGKSFTNNGVTIQLPAMYFSGDPITQAQKLAEAANISWGFPTSDTLEIWPRNGNRNTQNVPKISVATGMIGYPSFTQQGIIVSTLFNPAIQFGSLVEVDSSVLSAISQTQALKGNSFPTQWSVNKLDLALDAQLPGGQWMSTIYAYNPGKAPDIALPGH
jgi:hypothetical protein